ncbi:MAG: aldehyde dehydrogenase family protein [Chloroflexi bacterium]|nr:aldehyde dehydrogenase family protein [Chloroflexota bacterium]
MSENKPFKLTYSTMFTPPQELHDQFDAAIVKAKEDFGKEYPMFINGEERFSEAKHEAFSPVNRDWHLGTFQKGTLKDVDDAIAAARAALLAWRLTNWEERVYMLRKFADLVTERIFEISVATCLEVGKNRMESLGEVAEAADLVRFACDQLEKNHGFVNNLSSDPLVGFSSNNQNVLKPYGVWAVISPFNFPAALTFGPAGAALIAGNTVVAKPATDTSLTVTLMTECMRDAGIPAGVFNLVTGSGSVVGKALTDPAKVDGITFTGSKAVGMGIFRQFANGVYVKPTILELGGKNPTIVSRNADLEDAALGIARSAFGLSGQKCSACSRAYVERPVYDQLLERLVALTEKLSVGDPSEQNSYMGTVINQKAYDDYQAFVKELASAGKIAVGGKVLTDGDLSKGYYVTPTVAVDVPLGHRLWKEEMFLPIVLIAPVDSLEEGMRLANDTEYGLTAGFFGTDDECEWFFDHTEAGVVYANRPLGSTTGAWPGYQPFGGWKGSGSSGKNGGGLYYVQLYMHEQNRTFVHRL